MQVFKTIKSAIPCTFLLCAFNLFAQNKDAIPLSKARFSIGDNSEWKQPSFNDNQWKDINTDEVWQAQGYPDYHGYAWYRMHIVIPSSLKNNSNWKDSLRIFLAHVNDVDSSFLNGEFIGNIGNFPNVAGGYVSKWPAVRQYQLSINNAAIHWDKENIIAIKVYDGGGTGGLFMGHPYLDMLEMIDGISVSLTAQDLKYTTNHTIDAPISIQNKFNTSPSVSFDYTIFDAATNKTLAKKSIAINLKPFGKYNLKISMPDKEGIQFSYTLVDHKSTLALNNKISIPYILTPTPADKPSINGPSLVGARPGSPFLYKIPVSGKTPIHYSIKNLPAGLTLDSDRGIITGFVSSKGDYPLMIVANNVAGKAQRALLIKVGDQIALTPPMGWNSWNCWGTSVSDEKVRNSAQAMIDKGLINHGWSYINIDDGWEASTRAVNGAITTNDKFPDMKKLGDWLHAHGLKFGIYSSPGTLTCGGFLGSYQHEAQDAESYASWGIDYLKYDWCSYSDIVKDNDTITSDFIKPYYVMQKALAANKRDIYYSLCQYGMKNVGAWGRSVDAQSWRTTEDIEDTWQSLKFIGFSQAPHHVNAGPGGWNDPDMLIVGMVGWGENLHPTRLTPDEQYTHISLWSLLNAPLLIGCDMSRLDPFTINLLTNDEVIAINQDALGQQARQIIKTDSAQVWAKKLSNGNNAIGIFNMTNEYRRISVAWKDIGVKETQLVRDLWRQKNLSVISTRYTALVPPHGVKLISIKD